MKAIRKTTVKRTRSRMAEISLTLRWDPKALPKEQQEAIWKGIGEILAAVMTDDERRDFLAQLQAKAQGGQA